MPAARMGTALRLFWRAHRVFMRLTGGRFGQVTALPALLLTTRGRKSGERRDVVLSYVREDGAFVVIASYAGEDRDPSWWLNLRANPEAEVTVDGKKLRVRASELEGPRREELWGRAVRAEPSYAEYQRRTSRRIPVVLLDPIDPA